MLSRVTAKHVGDVFLRHSVFVYDMRFSTRAQLLLRWLHDVAQVECSLLSGGRTRMRLVLLLLLLLLHDLYSANFEDRVRGAGLCVSNSNIPPLHRFRQTTDYWSNFPCQQEIFLFNALFWGGG